MILQRNPAIDNKSIESIGLEALHLAEQLRRGIISAADAAIELVELLRRFKGGDA